MEPNLTVVGDDPPNSESAKKDEPSRLWRERQLSPGELFKATNEVGKFGWFYRLKITGLYPRRVGPFETQRAALESFEEFVAGVVVAICALQNEVNDDRYVVEGVPRLTGRLSKPTGGRRERKAS